MIWGGYLFIFGYLSVLLFLVGGLVKKFFGIEPSRKIIHIFTFGLFPIYHHFIGPGYHLIILCGAFLLLSAVSYSFGLIKTMERAGRGTPGTVYYALALLVLSILVYFFPDLYPYFGLAFVFLAFGDGMAGLIGHGVGGPKIHKSKTYFGSLACLVFGFLGGLVYSWVYLGDAPYLLLVLLAFMVTIIELVDYGLDNLFIPLLVFGLSAFALYQGNDALISTAIFCGLFLLIFLGKFMTYYGALFSSLIGATVYFCGSYPCLVFFIALYLVYFLVHLIKKRKRVEDDGVVEKGHRKDGWQVLANGSFCLVSGALFLLTGQTAFVLIMMSCCVALFTDTMASDLGALTRQRPYDVVHRRYVDKGVSGGMTLLGTLGSAGFAILASLALVWMLGYPLWASTIVAGIAIVSCFLDTLLGATVQVKYACPVCGKTIERKEHCGVMTAYLSGVKWIDNDVVNFVSAAFAFGLGGLLLLL